MNLSDVLDGGSMVAAAAIALFFWRFHRATGDRLFGFFAAAFAIFAVDRVLLITLPGDAEARTLVYLVRATAFVTIIVAIVEKNRGGAPARRPWRRPRVRPRP